MRRRSGHSDDRDFASGAPGIIGLPWAGQSRRAMEGSAGPSAPDLLDHWTDEDSADEEWPEEHVGDDGPGADSAGWSRLAYAALTVAAAGALYFLSSSALFRIQRVEVIGAHFLDRAAIVQAADVGGRNIFSTSSGAVEDRILRLGVPLRAAVFYLLPDTAVISIVERRPSYLWKVDQTLYLIADDGTVLGPTAVENQRVIVVDLDRRPIEVGQKVDLQVLQAAATVVDALPGILEQPPRYLLHRAETGLIIPASSAPQVILGDDNLSPKLNILGPVVRAAQTSEPPPTEIDLRLPDHPYFR